MRFTGRSWLRPLLVLTLTLAAAVVPTSAARAEEAATCSYEDTIVTSPGLTNQPTRYSFTSESRATITCFGMIGDVKVAGTGWFTEKGSGYGTCLEGIGSVDFVGALPTADGGELELTGHMWLVRTGLTGNMTGMINGVFVAGPYAVQPHLSDGRCTEVTPEIKATIYGVAAMGPLQDVVAPPSPTDFEGEQSEADVHLSWESGEGDPILPVVGYRVYRDGEDIATVAAETTTYIDSLVDPGTHTYTLAAFNGAGVESELAGPVSVTVVEGQPWAPQVFDPVMSPTHVKAKTSKSLRSDVELRWKEPLVGQPEFYRVYSSRDPFQPIATVSESSYVDPDVDFSCAKSYTYYVTAVDATGTEAWSEPLEVGPFTESGDECL